jgi:hypothetical protein
MASSLVSGSEPRAWHKIVVAAGDDARVNVAELIILFWAICSRARAAKEEFLSDNPRRWMVDAAAELADPKLYECYHEIDQDGGHALFFSGAAWGAFYATIAPKAAPKFLEQFESEVCFDPILRGHAIARVGASRKN